MDATSFSLLFAISTPVAAIAALHVWLALNGERGTLLLPERGDLEATSSQASVLGAMMKAAARARAEAAAMRIEAANDACERDVAGPSSRCATACCASACSRGSGCSTTCRRARA